MTTQAEKVNPFRAFRNRNYALFFAGQSTSQIGTWMQRTAVSWVIYSITHSASMLGLAVFAQQFPSFLFSLLGGIASDRYDRRKILLITQTASLIQSVLLAILTFTNHYMIWEIMALSVILGIVNAFDTPARQPMVHDLVSNKEDITNALALNSAMVNIARLVGPALSGIVLQSFGAHTCFILNAVSFLAVLASLLFLKLPPFIPPSTQKKVVAELSEGFGYLRQTPRIGAIILLMMCMAMFVFPYDTLTPVFAKTIFNGDARTFGYIASAVGFGAVTGSFFLAALKKSADLTNILLISIGVLGVGLIGFSQCTSFLTALPFAVIIGVASLTPATVSITIIQIEAAASMRGRVMSYVAMAYFGMLPLGSLLAGAASQQISAPWTMLLQGAISIITMVIFSRYLKQERMKKKEILETANIVTDKV
ncbi:MFS transporter [Chitinophaga pinensis]|uniref:Major facilitator superfamily MFS_1 n=1 Tax=Chitinophaga pinensis (strain ATCC 43595 / DSM 2588 / LMG 13176 / NBRC 15968 / NCIMB 11800 / UQM 2034) TaxID=485918 RepID=A0A979G9R9_CHIPD|nr:MFS transporter [Chitinophaga pinensis]ACU63233.1 major facilitator superfamily MFS_1 [Chitinophaga pinensis DSM 2588]